MSETDIQSFNSGMGQISADAASELAKGADEVYARLREEDKHDSMEKSNKQVKPEDVAGFINPAVPMLIPPQSNAADMSGLDQAKTASVSNAHAANSGAASGSTFSKPMDEALEGTMRGVLDSWQTATAKYVQESKDSNADAKATQEKADSSRWVRDVYQLGVVQSPHTTVVSAIMMAGMTGVMAGHKIDPTDPQHLGFDLNQQGIQAATPMIPSDMRAELGLLGALLMTPASYQATAMTIGKSEKTEGQQVNQQFARNYGDRMMTMVNDKNFNGWLGMIIQAKAPGDGPMSPQQSGEWMAAFKLGMLMSAYAVDYKTQYGGVSGKEVMGEIQNLDIGKAGGKAPLLDAVRQQIAALSPGQRDAVIQRLSDWLDSSPKVESLMDPLKVFSAISSDGQGAQRGRATGTPI